MLNSQRLGIPKELNSMLKPKPIPGQGGRETGTCAPSAHTAQGAWCCAAPHRARSACNARSRWVWIALFSHPNRDRKDSQLHRHPCTAQPTTGVVRRAAAYQLAAPAAADRRACLSDNATAVTVLAGIHSSPNTAQDPCHVMPLCHNQAARMPFDERWPFNWWPQAGCCTHG